MYPTNDSYLGYIKLNRTTVNNDLISDKADQGAAVRYYGLDALRAVAMALGIVLHASLPYFNTYEIWPSDDGESLAIWVVFEFIHIWRMPLFFILGGFFGALVVQRRSWKWYRNQRWRRIGLPLIVFLPLIALVMPYIWLYGLQGSIKGGVEIESYFNPWHLWFLFHLLTFVIVMAIWNMSRQLFSKLIPSETIRIVWQSSARTFLRAIYFPVPFALGVILMIVLIPSGAELIGNPLASFTYFLFGYGLFHRASLMKSIKHYWVAYIVTGSVGFIVYLWIVPQVTDIYNSGGENAGLGLLFIGLKVVCAVTFSLGLIGFAEQHLNTYNSRWRWLADSSYWVYLSHLPIVTFVTFLMFNISAPYEIKFLIAIFITCLLTLVTYRFFIRRTFASVFLNGRRYE